MRKTSILAAALALALPLAAQAAAPAIAWTIYSGDGQFSTSGTGSGSATIDFATYNFSSVNSPSPTLFVSGFGTGASGSHFDATLTYSISVTGPAPNPFYPAYCSAPPGTTCSSPYSAGPAAAPVTASGFYNMGSPNTYLKAAVGTETPFASCDSGVTSDCGFNAYTAQFGATSYTYNGFNTTFYVPLILHLSGDLFGGTSSFHAAIDPVISINPDFIAQSGFSASDFTIDFGGVGNTSNAAGVQSFTGGVPEPASWAMMLGGFGVIGAGLRRRRAVTVLA